MKLGRNEPCWCSSGKKFKKCHYGKEHDAPPTPEELKRLLKETFDKSYCLYSEAESGKCIGKIVKAHTIQRNGGLSKIAQNNHVYRIIPDSFRKPGMPRCILDSIGIKKASVFTGFCEYHDTQIFKPIEQFLFTGQQEQIFLLAYRPLCKEIFLKRNQFDLTEVSIFNGYASTVG
ncbi:MAG: SEC-C metal-binding domain-containing protein [Candidatus Omnitrophota bacterium]